AADLDVVRARTLADDLDRLALGRGPDAHDGVAGRRVGDGLAVPRHVGLRHLQGDRVDVVARQIVLAATGVARAVAKVDRVERGPEIDEERIVDRAGEDLAAAGQRPDRLAGDRRVVRDRLGTDVVRCDRQAAGDLARLDELAVLVRL